jgi:predicted RNA-binding protein
MHEEGPPCIGLIPGKRLEEVMCEANAYLVDEGREEMVLDSVDGMDVEGEEIRIVNIFGEQKMLRARFRSYSSAGRKILLEPIR